MKEIVIVSRQMGNNEGLMELLKALFPECEIRVALFQVEDAVSSPKGILPDGHTVDRLRRRRMEPKGLSNTNQRVHYIKGCDKTSLFFGRTEGRNRRILVVDDEEGIRQVLSRALSVKGYETITASNGSEALNLFLRNSFDLVITDLQMPRMDGWSLASRIKDSFPDTPVVLITARAKEEVLEKIEGSSVDLVIFKPFTLEEIEIALEDILEGPCE